MFFLFHMTIILGNALCGGSKGFAMNGMGSVVKYSFIS